MSSLRSTGKPKPWWDWFFSLLVLSSSGIVLTILVGNYLGLFPGWHSGEQSLGATGASANRYSAGSLASSYSSHLEIRHSAIPEHSGSQRTQTAIAGSGKPSSIP